MSRGRGGARGAGRSAGLRRAGGRRTAALLASSAALLWAGAGASLGQLPEAGHPIGAAAVHPPTVVHPPAAEPAPGPVHDPGLDLLRAELERLAETAGGVMGISVVHLESGREVHLNGDDAFPMASTYKVPIAVEFFRRVDRGEVSLDSLVAVEGGHYSPGSGTLSDLLIEPGVILSLRNLTELMLLISDNTATDLVLEAAGGPHAVTAGMEELGFPGIRVDRSTLELIADWVGVEDLPPRERLTLERQQELLAGVSPERREAAGRAFDDDPRDRATPREMAALLAGIWRDELLSEEMSALLRDIMERCRTGQDRIRGMIPPHATVSNKTGTIGGTLNDVGVIELPEERGHVVVVALIRKSEFPPSQRERAIAHVSRAIYDYFTLGPEG